MSLKIGFILANSEDPDEMPLYANSEDPDEILPYANSEDPDEMLHNAAFHLGPLCLPKYRE